MPDFAWSFDGPDPDAGWSTPAFPLGITSGGRHGNQAFYTFFSMPSRSTGGATYFGAAYKTASLGQAIMHLSGSNVANVDLEHVGDGRLQVRVAAMGQSTGLTLVPGFVMHQSRWYFVEFYADITTFSVVDNGDGTSTVTLEIDFEVRINNKSLLTGSYARVFVHSNPVPTPSISTIEFSASGDGTRDLDDVYFDSTGFQGDGEGAYDSGLGAETYTVNTVNPKMTLQCVEYGVRPEAPNNKLKMTFQGVEYGIRPEAPNNKLKMTLQCVEVGLGRRRSASVAFIDEVHSN